MTDFVEYNDYTNIKKKFSRFYETFIDKSRDANDIIPFLKNSFEHVDPSDKKNTNNFNLLTINNFSRLQAEALRCKIYNTEVLTSNYTINQTDNQKTGPVNSNSRTIGLINFTMDNEDIVGGSTPKSQFTNVSTDANNYVIRKSQSKIDLLFSTLVIIEIFIDILEAYKSFIDLDTNNNNNTIEHILIVGKNSRPGPYNNKNHGFYLKKKTGHSSISNYEYPNKSSLFLSIKSFEHIKGTNKKKYTKDIVIATSQNVASDTPSIFNADKETILTEFVINAVEIKVVNGTDTHYNGVESSGEITNLTGTTLNAKHDTHDILLGEILKHFINYIYKIKNNDRNIQINALLNYYKIMKCYLLKSVTVGNLLFNTLYNNSQGTTSDTSSIMLSQINNENGSVAINPIIIDASTIENIIIDDTISSPTKDNNYWTLIIDKNKTINDKIEELKNEINLSITNNDVPKISEQKPILFQGFLAKKIDEKTIEISFIRTDAGDGADLLSNFNSRSLDDFPEYLNKYNPSNSFEKKYYDSNNTLINDLSNEEKYLNEILLKSSERMKSDIKNQYQLEINRRLYKIVDITTEVVASNGISYNKIVSINIKARFDYVTNIDSDIDFFKLERNTYQILNTVDNRLVSDINLIVNTDGKIISKSSLIDKSIILYNFTNIHPNAENNVIMNKSVDHTDKKANNIRDLREVNNKIILNEMKINNSGRLYEIQDNKYNILNNQLIVYYVIVAIIIAIIVIINISNMDKSLIKTVTTGCFSVIVFLFISYYMVNILYVEGFSNIEHFNITAQAFTYLNGKDEFESVSKKVREIQSTMTSLEFDISRLFDVLTVSIPQTTFTDTNNMLNNILEGEKNDKVYVNDNLKHSRVNAYNHIDIKKYEIMNIQILIKAFLYTSFVIFGLYTLQLYIDIKYLDILIFITAILLIIIFTYYIVYSNVIVRTISRNKYWGKEYESSYK